MWGVVPARVGPAGELILLEAQDRSRWDLDKKEEGLAVLERALRMGRIGPYQLQAAISALHMQAARPEETDWPQIAALYGLLRRTGRLTEASRAYEQALSRYQNHQERAFLQRRLAEVSRGAEEC